MSFHRIALLFSISLILGGIENRCHGIDFRSDQLEEISRFISVKWPQGADSTFTVRHGKRNVTVRVADNCVEHIGFRIFPERLRSGEINPMIADFVERYWLSLTLPLKRLKSVKQQMLEDKFVFHTGGIESIDGISRDSTLTVTCHITPRKVTVVWGDIRQPVCSISFPVDHELLLGRRMLENDRRLPQEINSVKTDRCAVKEAATAFSLPTDSLTSLIIRNQGSYIDCALKSERYYTMCPDSMHIEPVFDIRRCQESVSNLFTGCDIEQACDITLSIRHKIFGLKEQPIETTVRNFVAYSMQNGCIPFVGIISIGNDDSGVVDALVIMHNRQLGYNHILRVEVPLECIAAGSGAASARLNAFVPSSNIKNLFKD